MRSYDRRKREEARLITFAYVRARNFLRVEDRFRVVRAMDLESGSYFFLFFSFLFTLEMGKSRAGMLRGLFDRFAITQLPRSGVNVYPQIQTVEDGGGKILLGKISRPANSGHAN